MPPASSAINNADQASRHTYRLAYPQAHRATMGNCQLAGGSGAGFSRTISALSPVANAVQAA